MNKETPIKFTSEITYSCPKCRMLLSYETYCPKCNQKLDWSDNNG